VASQSSHGKEKTQSADNCIWDLYACIKHKQKGPFCLEAETYKDNTARSCLLRGRTQEIKYKRGPLFPHKPKGTKAQIDFKNTNNKNLVQAIVSANPTP
jgi:hypothetical protein